MHRIWRVLTFLSGVSLLLMGCSPHRFFYIPTNKLYSDPAQHGMPYDLLEIKSLNGKTLSAILFKTDRPVKGTVVHFHGNYGNVSNHYTGSQFLVKYGFDVIVFDYEGYGGSDGSPSPKHTVQDGQGVVRYAQENLRPPASGVVIFGQSLGAAVGAVVAAKEPKVKAVVLEASFTSYRSIARDVLKRSVWTWPVYPFYPLFLGKTYDPIRYVAAISPRPVFFIHGDKDTIVPEAMSEKLFAAAREPKRLWIIKGADHLECRQKKGAEYEQAIADFFSNALQK